MPVLSADVFHAFLISACELLLLVAAGGDEDTRPQTVVLRIALSLRELLVK